MECFFFVIINLKPSTLLVALFLILLSTPPSMADDNNDVKGVGVSLGDIATNSSSQSPPPVSSEIHQRSVPFRPSMLVVIVVLAAIFSVVFLVLLYAKHCNGGRVLVVTDTPATIATARRNSGIDRGVVESLPVFRFGSLRGQKEGLDCAVCLNRFDSNEVLRLLPKCKHAFHVECVDTWLDAHSTCPLCRYRVDPEDILLVDENPPRETRQNSTHEVVLDVNPNPNPIGYKRLSGRHSSGGEKGILRSKSHEPASLRRSLDSAGARKKSQSLRAVGSHDYPRKDGLLSTSLDGGNSRVEHRIIVSSNPSRADQSWSDAQPSDLLYLGSEMIMSDSRRLLWTSRSRLQQQSNSIDGNGNGWRRLGGGSSGGRNNNTNTNNNNNNTVMNSRSVSEITGFSRFPIKDNRANSTH